MIRLRILPIEWVSNNRGCNDVEAGTRAKMDETDECVKMDDMNGKNPSVGITTKILLRKKYGPDCQMVSMGGG